MKGTVFGVVFVFFLGTFFFFFLRELFFKALRKIFGAFGVNFFGVKEIRNQRNLHLVCLLVFFTHAKNR